MTMTEFRVTGVKAGYHTGESLSTRGEGTVGGGRRGEGGLGGLVYGAEGPSEGCGGHRSTQLSIHQRGDGTDHRISLSKDNSYRFFSHRRRKNLQELQLPDDFE